MLYFNKNYLLSLQIDKNNLYLRCGLTKGLLMDDIIFSKTKNNIELKFNSSHYIEVRKKHPRKDLFLMGGIFNSSYHAGHQIIEHPLLYKVVKCNETGTLYIVSKVLKTFYAGWYYTAQLDTIRNSSNIVHLTNINSIAGVEFSFDKDYTITDITIEEFFNNKINTFGNHSEPAINWFNRAKEFNNIVINHFSNLKEV